MNAKIKRAIHACEFISQRTAAQYSCDKQDVCRVLPILHMASVTGRLVCDPESATFPAFWKCSGSKWEVHIHTYGVGERHGLTPMSLSGMSGMLCSTYLIHSHSVTPIQTNEFKVEF